jgi:hypothetical protein
VGVGGTQVGHDVLVDADGLQRVDLEEVSQPKHILNQVQVSTLLLHIPTGPEHLASIHEVQHNPECLGFGPQREQDSDLRLLVLDVGHYLSELGGLLGEVLFESEEFNVLHHEAHLEGLVVRLFIPCFIVLRVHRLLVSMLLLFLLLVVHSELATGLLSIVVGLVTVLTLVHIL